MEVTDSFSSLPNEIVVDILSRLTKSSKDLMNAYQVCSRWKMLIDTAVGFQLFIGTNKMWEKRTNHAGWSGHNRIEAIELYGARACHLSLEPLVNSVGEIPQFRQSTMLKELYLDTPLSAFAYVQLTKRLTNIRWIYFDMATLSSLPLKGLPVGFELLRALHLSMITYHADFVPNIEQILDNVMYLMDLPQTFKHLTRLELKVPYHTQRCKSVTDAVLKFIARHKRTLRNVTVKLDDHSEGGLEAPISVSTEKGVLTEDMRCLRLKTCTLHSALPGGGQMTGLRAIMESQTQLLRLSSTTGYEPFTRMSQTFSSCSRTLTVVEMSIGTENVEGPGVDFRVFEACESLRVLALLGPAKIDDNEDPFDLEEDDIDARMLTPDITGTQYLPNSLEIVKIYNLFMQSTDAKIIVNKPILQAICLQNIGRYGTLGLNYSDAIDLFTKRSLRSIRWAECININSIPSFNIAADPMSMFNAILLRQIISQTFCVHINEAETAYVPGPCKTGGDVTFRGNRLLDKHVFTLEPSDSDDEDEEVVNEAEEAEGEAEEAEGEADEAEGEADEAEGEVEEAEDAEDEDEEAEDEGDEAVGQENMEMEIEEDDHFAFAEVDGANPNAHENDDGYVSEED